MVYLTVDRTRHTVLVARGCLLCRRDIVTVLGTPARRLTGVVLTSHIAAPLSARLLVTVLSVPPSTTMLRAAQAVAHWWRTPVGEMPAAAGTSKVLLVAEMVFVPLSRKNTYGILALISRLTALPTDSRGTSTLTIATACDGRAHTMVHFHRRPLTARPTTFANSSRIRPPRFRDTPTCCGMPTSCSKTS